MQTAKRNYQNNQNVNSSVTKSATHLLGIYYFPTESLSGVVKAWPWNICDVQNYDVLSKPKIH